MSRRETRVSLLQMRDHAREALAMIEGRRREDLDADRLLNLALVRLLEVVGEAAPRVPRQEQARNPAIAWSQIVGLRNRLSPIIKVFQMTTVALATRFWRFAVVVRRRTAANEDWMTLVGTEVCWDR